MTYSVTTVVGFSVTEFDPQLMPTEEELEGVSTFDSFDLPGFDPIAYLGEED